MVSPDEFFVIPCVFMKVPLGIKVLYTLMKRDGGDPLTCLVGYGKLPEERTNRILRLAEGRNARVAGSGEVDFLPTRTQAQYYVSPHSYTNKASQVSILCHQRLLSIGQVS